MSEIFARAPLWVWFVLAGLLVLGLMQARDRHRSALVAVLPSAAFSIYSLFGALTPFAAPFLAVAAWLLGFAMALLVTRPALGKALARLRSHPREPIFLPGSYVPLILFLGIFVLRYALNVIRVVRPELMAMPVPMLTLAGALGLLSGLLLGRSLREIGKVR